MHKYLKCNRLRVVRRRWMLLKGAEAVLSDLTLTIEARAQLERELGQGPVKDCITWPGRTDVRKHRCKNGREANPYDLDRHLIIEAKANHRDDVMVVHGMVPALKVRGGDAGFTPPPPRRHDHLTEPSGKACSRQSEAGEAA